MNEEKFQQMMDMALSTGVLYVSYDVYEEIKNHPLGHRILSSIQVYPLEYIKPGTIMAADGITFTDTQKAKQRKVRGREPMRLGWSPSSKFCAQMAHLFCAHSFIISSAYHGFSLLTCLIAVVVIGAIKEFVLDIWVIENDSWWGSGCDFCFYVIGGLLGYIDSHSYPITLIIASLIVLAMARADSQTNQYEEYD